MYVKQHVPSFMAFEPAEADVSSLEELLALKFIDRFVLMPEFKRLCIARQDERWQAQGYPVLLMAEFSKGPAYLVIAHLSGPDQKQINAPIPIGTDEGANCRSSPGTSAGPAPYRLPECLLFPALVRCTWNLPVQNADALTVQSNPPLSVLLQQHYPQSGRETRQSARQWKTYATVALIVPRISWRKSSYDGRAKVPSNLHANLEEIVAYWTGRDQPERGEQYAHDLPSEAIRQQSDPSTARAGRHLRRTAYPQTQELLVKRSYRIWHSHRYKPFKK